MNAILHTIKAKVVLQFVSYVALLFPCALFPQSSPSSDTLVQTANASSNDSLAAVDKMVITASRTPRSIKETPAVVSVITKEQIEASPAKNISDILLYEPGVVVQRPVGWAEGVPAGINIRGVPSGLTATRTLILVDGIPTNAVGTPFLFMNEAPMESIERIEVVRGPYSNLYGANALGGVINIITKNAPSGFHGSVYGGIGYYVLREFGATNSFASGKFSYFVNGAYRGTDNYLAADSTLYQNGTAQYYRPVLDRGYNDQRLIGKIGYAFNSRTTLTVYTRFFNSDLQFGRTWHLDSLGIMRPSDIVRSTAGRKFLIGPVLKINIADGFDVKFGGYFRTLTGKYLDEGYEAAPPHDTVPSIWTASSNDGQVDGQATLRLAEHHVLTAGFDALENSINFGANVNRITGDTLFGAYGTKQSITNLGVFLQDEMKYFDRLVFIAGTRVDYHSVYGVALSPRLGASYKLTDNIRLRSSAGRAFRAPNLTELYMPDLMLGFGKEIVHNDSLKPEYIWTIDGGAETDFTKWLTFHADGFYNRMDNLIGPVLDSIYTSVDVPNGGAKVTQINLNRAISAGMETGATLRLKQWLSVFRIIRIRGQRI